MNNTPEEILKKHLATGHEEIEVSFHRRDIELMIAAMEEHAQSTQQAKKCTNCNGDGYTAEHDLCDPHIDGVCCGGCPIQVQCAQQSKPNGKINYPILGYAPGNYTCRCSTCKETFIGDKGAVQCFPCAVNMLSSTQQGGEGVNGWLNNPSNVKKATSDLIGIMQDYWDLPEHEVEAKISEYIYTDMFSTHSSTSDGEKVKDKREFPCTDCEDGEFVQVGHTQPNGQVKYECNSCGKEVSFP